MALYAKQMQVQEKHYLSRSYPIEGSNDSLSDHPLFTLTQVFNITLLSNTFSNSFLEAVQIALSCEPDLPINIPF